MQSFSHTIFQQDKCRIRGEQGFTLVEMLISMAMGLIIIAGLTSVFISDSNVSRTLSSRTERMGDLFLASHLMQQALRESLKVPDPTTPINTNLTARSVSLPSGYPADTTFTTAGLPYWDDATKTLTYQNLDGNVGIFQYKRTSNDRIYWLRPLSVSSSGSATFQELMRDLDTTNGMRIYNPATNSQVTSALGGGMKIELQSTFTNENKVKNKTLSLSFMAWPRN